MISLYLAVPPFMGAESEPGQDLVTFRTESDIYTLENYMKEFPICSYMV